MANAVKKISVQRGHDITRYALTSFGGAGGQHACAVADALGIGTVLVPPLAGVLSAYGIGVADATAMREQAVEAEFDDAGAMERLRERVRHAGGAGPRANSSTTACRRRASSTRARVLVRYAGTDSTIGVAAGRRRRDGGGIRPGPPHPLRLHHGQAAGGRGGVGRGARRGGRRRPPRVGAGGAEGELRPVATVRMYTRGGRRDTGLYRRTDLRPGDTLNGPAIIAEDDATTVLDPGWQAARRRGPVSCC